MKNADAAKTTETGKCQICERTMKVRPDGYINMHGHNRAGAGRCAGFCPGSARHPGPATEALEEQIAALRAQDAVRYAGLIAKYERRIAAYAAQNIEAA